MVRLIKEWSYSDEKDQVEINGYYISIESNGRTYVVQACPIQDEERGLCGASEVRNVYGDYDQAKRRFDFLKRKYSRI